MIGLKNIDAIFFDMDGTLIDLKFDNTFWKKHLPEKYASHHDISLKRSNEKLMQYNHLIAGTLNWYCLDHWDKYLNMETESLAKELLHLIRYRPYAKELLCALQHSPISTAIITNAHPRSFNLKEHKLKMTQYVDFVAISHHYGYPKEEQGFWHALQKAHPFNPERTLLVDDNVSVLKSAQRYGIKNLLAIPNPDSSCPADKITEFAKLDDFRALFPASKK